MMKKLCLFLLACIAVTIQLSAQDEQKIALSTYISEQNSGIPNASLNLFESKLKNLITSCGFGNEINQRFIITAKVNIVSEDITPTTPAMFAYNLSFDLYIGDGMTGKLFESTQIPVKGVGKTKDKAFIMALGSLNPHDKNLKHFVENGKKKIIDYYNMNGEAILKKAEVLAANQNYDEAMFELSCIPSECSKYYGEACDMMVTIYQKSIDQEGDRLLAEAISVWNAGQDADAAEKVISILAQINPQSAAFVQAKSLGNEISKRIKELDKREWDFMVQQQKDETEIRKAQIKSARDVAVTWASHQPKTIYKVYWW